MLIKHEDGRGWQHLQELGASRFVNEIIDEWIVSELGMRVHDYIFESNHLWGAFGWSALDDAIYEEWCRKQPDYELWRDMPIKVLWDD